MAVRFTLSIESGNDALVEDPSYAVYAAVQAVANKVSAGHTSGTVLDLNGNAVGEWSLETD